MTINAHTGKGEILRLNYLSKHIFSDFQLLMRVHFNQ